MVHDLRRRDFDDFIPDDFFGNFGKNFFKSFGWDGHMKTDIVEKDDEYKVSIDLPGMDKKDIKLDFKNDVLSVQAERNVASEAKDDEGRVISSERHYGTIHRQYRLPNIKASDIKASYDKGELTIILPKEKKEQTDSSIAID